MSRRHKPKRNKQYRPRQVRIPVTGLRDEFGLELHSALAAAQIGYFSKGQYDRIGQAFNCVYGALVLQPPKDASVVIVIDGAIRAMNECGRRGDASGTWSLRELEQAAVLAGVRKMEEHLPLMDVSVLYDSMQRLKAMYLQDQIDKQTFIGIDPASGPDRTVDARTGAEIRVTDMERITA